MKISFTKVDTYSTCGLRYHFRYNEGITTPSRPRMILGKGVHHGIEHAFRWKIQHNELPHAQDCLDLFRDDVSRAFQENILLDKDETRKGAEASVVDKGVSLLEMYIRDHASFIQPIAVEEPFLIPLGDCRITGYIDLIEEGSVVRDFKTKEKAPSADETDKSQQLTIYALGYRQLFGDIPDVLYLDHLVTPGKKVKARMVSQPTVREEEDFTRLLLRISRILDGIRKEVFIPPPQGSWACGYCDYRVMGVCDEYLI